jgi:flavodoxin
MKKLLVILAAVCSLFILGGCGSAGSKPADAAKTAPAAAAKTAAVAAGSHKVLVTYFSWSGNTRKVAEAIKAQTGGDLFEIKTQNPYPTDYHACTDIAKKELNEKARPAVAAKADKLEQYDVIFVGYPIWWGDAPMVVYTFLEGSKLDGKTIVPFATSGGSGIETSVKNITKDLPKAKVAKGLLVRGQDELAPWLKELGLGK